jgi:hypothetical protein
MREARIGKERAHRLAIGEVHPDKAEGWKPFENTKARFLQCRIVVVIDDIETDYLLIGRRKPLCDVKADEARSTRH